MKQTVKILAAEKPGKRLYSLHEPSVAAIKEGKSHTSCEFGSVISLSMNDDGLILSHNEYQHIFYHLSKKGHGTIQMMQCQHL